MNSSIIIIILLTLILYYFYNRLWNQCNDKTDEIATRYIIIFRKLDRYIAIHTSLHTVIMQYSKQES